MALLNDCRLTGVPHDHCNSMESGAVRYGSIEIAFEGHSIGWPLGASRTVALWRRFGISNAESKRRCLCGAIQDDYVILA